MNLKRKIIPFIFSSLILFGLNKSLATDIINIDGLTRENLKEASINLTSNYESLERQIYLKVNVDTVSNEHNSRNIVSRRISDTNGDFYQWNVGEIDHKVATGQNVWKIKKYQDSNYTTVMNDTVYCLQRNIGFASSENESMTDSSKNRKIYTTSHDMKNEIDNIKTKFSNLNISKDSSIYNKVLWILDNAYIKTGENNYKDSANYKKLMNNAEIEIENKDWDLTEEDIEVIQQMSIWYFTNYSELNSLPSIYINGEQLSSIYYETDEHGVQYTGVKRQEKANKLYQYLISQANKNANYTGVQDPSLTLNKDTNINIEESGNYYIVGPYSLTGQNTSSILSITGSLNNNNINYTLLNSSKNVVENNDLSKVISGNFYLKINKSAITPNTTSLNFGVKYSYSNKKIIFWSDESNPNSTQPVAIIGSNSVDKTLETSVNITSVTVRKVWDDGNNQDGKRPSSIKVALYKNNQKIDEVTLTSSLEYTWNGLISGTYTVKELNGNNIITDKYNDDYTTSYGISGNITTITNTHIPEKINKKVIKQWDDNNNQDRKRPESITIELLQKIGSVQSSTNKIVTLNQENNWEFIFTDLPKYSKGTEIEYIVKENIPDGYVSDADQKSFKIGKEALPEVTIKNTYTPGTVNKTVKKIWEDQDNADGSRPKEVKVQLYAGERPEGNPITLSKENGFEYTWIGLPEKANGVSIIYTVKELNTSGEAIENNDSYNSYYTTLYSEDTFTITNIHKSFDLALRKFIVAVNDKELKNTDGTYTRQPKVDISTIATNGTAAYKHTKEPVTVEPGDIVTYVIRVYNEGNLNGYVSEITDYLPEYLEFLPEDEINKNYLWSYKDEDTRIISTAITAENSATGENLYKAKKDENREKGQLLLGYNNSSNELDYIDVKIKCKVNEKVITKHLLTNIAEITGVQNEDGNTAIDRDSHSKVNLPEDGLLSEYKGNSANKTDLTDKEYYYAGQEDDDDFEKLIVQKFDLSLKKFIVKVNDVELKNAEGKYTREPVVDATKLGTVDENTKKEITNATYTMPKDPVKVKNGDIITYTIRVYNEGSLAGYAKEITENIPEGLEFIKYDEGDESINDVYGWKMLDKDMNSTTTLRNAKYLTTDYLSDIIIPEANVSEEGAAIAYQDVQIQFKVILEPVKFEQNIIKNVAQISDASNNDIDSEPSRTDEYNANEDDIDYEPIQVTYFNLALRKFVTKVDSTDYNNRYPEIIYNENGSINYKHTKDPVDVVTGATVVYTIRVYNEGNLSGFAEEITDDLPDGLEFLPDNEINKEYKWKMLDKDGELTTNIITAEKVTTDYLSSNDPSMIIDSMKIENGQKIVSYKEVKIAFKVTEKEMSDKLLINIATVTKTSEKDIDPSDDSDKEYVKIQNFDLSLKKWVTKTIVTYNGKTTTKETGFNEDSTEMAKVDIVGKQAKKTNVKFVYKIKVTNEGKIAGYATEVKDYIPKGLEFVESDNNGWTLDKEGNAVTSELENTLLHPGESATVEITLRWKQSTSNMGVKTNYAEISKDSGDDIDSTPDNYDLKEDDIDNASVVISIKTGVAKTYILLTVVLIAILGSGAYLIKKYVID